MRRRSFLKNTAMGMAALAGTSLTELKADAPKADGPKESKLTGPEMLFASNPKQKVGRPVRIVSIGFKIKNPPPLKTIVQHVDEEGARGVDVIILPEVCQGQDKGTEEPLHGATVTALAALAKKHKTYIAVPIDRKDGNQRLNSLVFLDRSGQVAAIYNKVFPYWSEFDLAPTVDPGKVAEVYQADFGRVGFSICFDANFPEVWKSLADKGAEMVIWPSAYSAGMSLQSHAINHHYYIVSATQVPDCMVYDITGEQMLHRQAKDMNISRVTLDLDRGVYHQNFNMEKRDKLLKEHAADVMQEKWLESEQWFVLKAKRPGVSARELAHKYSMEEVRHYIERSRVSIDKMRGWEFAKKATSSNA